MKPSVLSIVFGLALGTAASSTSFAAELKYTVSWLGNSFSGASNKWVQNFFIHPKVQPDGTVNTWSHWDEGRKKFGVYKDGDAIGNTNVNPNSLEVADKAFCNGATIFIARSRSGCRTTHLQCRVGQRHHRLHPEQVRLPRRQLRGRECRVAEGSGEMLVTSALRMLAALHDETASAPSGPTAKP